MSISISNYGCAKPWMQWCTRLQHPVETSALHADCTAIMHNSQVCIQRTHEPTTSCMRVYKSYTIKTIKPTINIWSYILQILEEFPKLFFSANQWRKSPVAVVRATILAVRRCSVGLHDMHLSPYLCCVLMNDFIYSVQESMNVHTILKRYSWIWLDHGPHINSKQVNTV